MFFNACRMRIVGNRTPLNTLARGITSLGKLVFFVNMRCGTNDEYYLWRSLHSDRRNNRLYLHSGARVCMSMSVCSLTTQSLECVEIAATSVSPGYTRGSLMLVLLLFLFLFLFFAHARWYHRDFNLNLAIIFVASKFVFVRYKVALRPRARTFICLLQDISMGY